MQFYTILDNTGWTKGYPWITKIIKGLPNTTKCNKCGSVVNDPYGDIYVEFEKNKGSKWPDVLGCGDYPILILSDKVIESFCDANIESLPMHRVLFTNYPAKLTKQNAPKYFWIEGKKILGAKVDFEKSGFVEVKFCKKCGARSDNIKLTFDKQINKNYPIVFKENTYKGLNLFTTDISSTLFFCTELIFTCVKKNKLTNFCFK